MKDLKNLEGAKMLSKNDQKGIKGGLETCRPDKPCNEPWDYCDDNGICRMYPPGS